MQSGAYTTLKEALFTYIKSGDSKTFDLILTQNRESIDDKGPKGETLLYTALEHTFQSQLPKAKGRCKHAIYTLIKLGANTNIVTHSNWSIFHLLARDNFIGLFEFLKKQNAITDKSKALFNLETTALGLTPLMIAAKNDAYEMLNALHLAGANINHQNAKGETALSFALQAENIRCLKALKEKGAAYAEVNHKETSANILHLCAQEEMVESLTYFMEQLTIDDTLWEKRNAQSQTPLAIVTSQKWKKILAQFNIQAIEDEDEDESIDDGTEKMHSLQWIAAQEVARNTPLPEEVTSRINDMPYFLVKIAQYQQKSEEDRQACPSPNLSDSNEYSESDQTFLATRLALRNSPSK